MQHFGRWVRAERESRKMTATECGERCNPPMTVSGWSNIERGTASPNVETVQKIAGVFGMSFEDVMVATGVMSPSRPAGTDWAQIIANSEEAVPYSKRNEFRMMAIGTVRGLAAAMSTP